MSEQPEEIKRWTARRKSAVVMGIIKGKTSASEVARSHDLTVGEIEQWMDDFISMGTEALRSHPRDAEARHKAKEKELLAKIGELTMEKEIWKVTREVMGKPLRCARFLDHGPRKIRHDDREAQKTVCRRVQSPNC